MILEAAVAVGLWFTPVPQQDHSEFLGSDDDTYWEEETSVKTNYKSISEEWKKLPDGSYLRTLRNVHGETLRMELHRADSWTVRNRTSEQLDGEAKKEVQ